MRTNLPDLLNTGMPGLQTYLTYQPTNLPTYPIGIEAPMDCAGLCTHDHSGKLVWDSSFEASG